VRGPSADGAAGRRAGGRAGTRRSWNCCLGRPQTAARPPPAAGTPASSARLRENPRPTSNTTPDPKILLLNIELELKSEKENAEIRLEDPGQYQVGWGGGRGGGRRQAGGRAGADKGNGAGLHGALPGSSPKANLNPHPHPTPQSIVDAEWNIIYDKLAKCVDSGAQVGAPRGRVVRGPRAARAASLPARAPDCRLGPPLGP
jgi:hypothetical protein